MAEYHIGRGTTRLGVFTEEEVREGLGSGRFFTTDLGWTLGMDEWKPLSEFPDLIAPSGPPPIEDSATPPFLSDLEPSAAEGLPWENRGTSGFAGGFIGTVKQVLLQPARAFAAMKREGGLGDPFIFALIGGWIGGAFELAYSYATQLAMPGAMESLSKQDGIPPILKEALEKAGQMSGLDFLERLVLMPVYLLLMTFVGAAVLHLFLILVGGAKQPFEATYRVLCYSLGATFLLKIIPFCGGLATAVWLIVALCIGLQTSHQTTTGKAITAVLLPFILCCCGLFTLVAMALGAAGANGLK